MKKTTLYIDVDDDIAAIIDKVSAADQKIVALVLPKRPSTLQGSVNLQLLKKSAEDVSKSLVLITTDEQVIQLAGQTSMHVSSSLQSKPYIPKTEADDESIVEELTDDSSVVPAVVAGTAAAKVIKGDPAQPDVYADGAKVDMATPIGVLAGDGEEDIELDNSEPADEEPKDTVSDDKSVKKKIKVPNFGKFRSKLGMGALGLVALITFLFWALVIAPKATVVIATEKSEVQSKITVTASTATTVVDAEKGLVPAVKKEDKQKLSSTFKATGQKDAGEAARGTVSFRNCESPSAVTIPKGTGVSRGQVTFITQEDYSVPGATIGPGLSCISGYTGDVDVVANIPGGEYNYSSGTSFTAPDSLGSITSRASSDFSGGTTKVVTVVSASDVETAKSKVLEDGSDNVSGKLSQLLKDDGLVPVDETFSSTNGEAVSSIPVGSEATSDPTITIEVISTMLGVKKTDIDPLVQKDTESKIDPNTQKIYSTGLDSAVIGILERPNPDTVKMTIATTVSVGPKLDSATVATEIAGKKAGEAKQLLESKPGVSSAEIRLSPFWVFSLPKNTSKISVSINE